MPKPHAFRNQKSLRWVGEVLHSPNLWHLNRRSVSGAFAVGMLCAFVPIPFQMVLAAFCAIFYRVNLPVATSVVWITNPITYAPVFYLCYQVGSVLMDSPPKIFKFEISFEWFSYQISEIWEPLLLGCFVLGTACAALSYFIINLLWRWFVVRTIRKRKLRSLNPDRA